MSGLESFQCNEEWLANLKTFLCMQRQTLLETDINNKQNIRYSLDISEDLKSIIEKNKKIKENNMDNLEYNSGMAEAFNGEKMQHSHTPIIQSSDESFAALEVMCNNTASDPNSTLFKYLHSEDQNVVLAEVKHRNFDDIHNKGVKTQEILLEKLRNCTILDEIEAPTRFWENTISEDNIYQTSPVKMVGLMRPSTIVEESDDLTNSTDLSLQTVKRSTSDTSIYDSLSSAKNAVPEIILNCENDHVDKNDSRHHCNIPSDDKNFTGTCNETIIEIFSEDENGDRTTISDYRQDYNEISSSDDKENYDNNFNANESMHFNDTMEEVEYLLKKRNEYMAASKIISKEPISQFVVVTSPKSTSKQNKFDNLEEKTSQSILTTVKPVLIAKKKKKFNKSGFVTPTQNSKIVSKNLRQPKFEVKPFPKLDIFGKETSTYKRSQYSHVASPVGIYIKHTGTTPLMSTIKTKTKKFDLLKASALKEYKDELNLCHIEDKKRNILPKLPMKNQLPLLPKKAYVSSELKHIVDERIPVTIPGVTKIQKYLEKAMTPTVLRHDGKIKTPNRMESTVKFNQTKETKNNQSKQQNNASLANLSIVSGDVSMYTIMDAQKF